MAEYQKNKLLHTIRSTNGYMATVKTPLSSSFQETLETLSMYNFHTYGLIPTDTVTINDEVYVPVGMEYTVVGVGGHFHRTCEKLLYVRDAKRVLTSHVVDKLADLLKNEYEGSFEAIRGRYMFKMQFFAPELIYKWLEEAKRGKNQVIDYTWIAPLQELSAYHADKPPLADQPFKRTASRLRAYKDPAPTPKPISATKSVNWHTGIPSIIDLGDPIPAKTIHDEIEKIYFGSRYREGKL